jgi:hypothetical protein
MLGHCQYWRNINFETSFSLYITVFDVVIEISCMYFVAYLPLGILVCTRPGRQVDTLLDWRLQNCTVHVIITMKKRECCQDL